MKANELMIYNWVLYNGYPNIVTGIIPPSPTEDKRWDGKWVIEINPPDIFNVTLDELEPIPITEEWLLKFGFEKKITQTSFINLVHFENKNCWIYLIKDGFEFELITGNERHNLCKTYKYVHQLQNLYFALTGEELIFKQD